MAIFVLTTTTTTTTIRPITLPLAHARGVITDSRSLLWSELVRLNLDTSYVLIIVYYTIVITCHVTDYDVHVPCVIYDMESY